jgi:hypothetical protein
MVVSTSRGVRSNDSGSYIKPPDVYTAVLTKVVQLIRIYQLKKRLDLPKNSVNFADSICRINLSLPNCV